MTGPSRSVRVRGLPILHIAGPLLITPLLLLPSSTPPEEQFIDTVHLVLWVCVLMAATALLGLWSWRSRGGDECLATDAGLVLRSKRYGDRFLAWDELVELGSVQRHLLAGRTRAGKPYDSPGPFIAGWLCRPAGVVTPRMRRELQELAELHDIPWRTYAPAEVGVGWN